MAARGKNSTLFLYDYLGHLIYNGGSSLLNFGFHVSPLGRSHTSSLRKYKVPCITYGKLDEVYDYVRYNNSLCSDGTTLSFNFSIVSELTEGLRAAPINSGIIGEYTPSNSRWGVLFVSREENAFRKAHYDCPWIIEFITGGAQTANIFSEVENLLRSILGIQITETTIYILRRETVLSPVCVRCACMLGLYVDGILMSLLSLLNAPFNLLPCAGPRTIVLFRLGRR